MERTINNFRKTLLYLNASSRHLIGLIDSRNNLTDSQTRIASFLLNYSFEGSIVYYLRSSIPSFTASAFTVCIILLILFHVIIDLVFTSDLKAMDDNYNFYYRKAWFYFYCVLPLIGIAYLTYYYLHYS